MGIIRKKQQGEFTIISNNTLRDERLSLDALGLLARLLSRPENWVIRPWHLRQESNIGRTRLTRIIRELEAAGYLRRKKTRRPDGTWDWTSEVYEEAICSNNEPATDGICANGKAADGFIIDGQSGDIEIQRLKKQKEKYPERGLSRKDFLLSDVDINWANLETPLINPKHETKKFIDHPSGVQQFHDYEELTGAWRNWMRHGQIYAASQKRNPQQGLPSMAGMLTDTDWIEEI